MRSLISISLASEKLTVIRGSAWSVVLFFVSSWLVAARGDDWPQWGGPRRDCVWYEDGIVEKFSTTELLPRKWSAKIGEGYSGPAVAEGRVILTDRIQNEQNERVLCFDAETGGQLWKYEHPSRYTIDYPAGPRSTPLIHDGYVYTVGAMGNLLCLSLSTGEIVWQKYFPTDYETNLPAWGIASSPLIDGDKLIAVTGGANGALVVCFHRLTGQELWRALQDSDVGYCQPVIYEFGGVRQLIVWHPAAISALDPGTGFLLWEENWTVKYGMTIPMPRQQGDLLFFTAFYEGPKMLRVSSRSAEVVWKGKTDNEITTDGLHSIMSTPVVQKDHIFGICSYGQLRCLRTSDGQRLWETDAATGNGRWWNAFIIPHGDRFFLNNEQGELIIAHLTQSGYEELSRARLVEPTRPVRRRQTAWSHPAFAMKSVFARNDLELVRVDLAKQQGD